MDEINEVKLDSPLVVHKKDDASYSEAAAELAMNATHSDEESTDLPTLERHRFRKEKRNHKGILILIALIAIAVAVLCGLIYGGKLDLSPEESTTKVERTYTTKAQNKFEGVITIKGTYIFYEGVEVDGINGLEREIKYLEKGTKFTVQDEHADSNFLNYEVLSLLSQYELDYDITHIQSSGLESEYETTTTTTKEIKTTQKTSTEKNSEQTSQAD